MTILIAEGEPILRNLMLGHLSRANHVVLEADNAAEALELSIDHAGVIELLITNHILQTMTGPQLAKSLRGTRADLKVPYFTDNPSELLLGDEMVFDFLTKPFSQETLCAKVKEIIDRPQAAVN